MSCHHCLKELEFHEIAGFNPNLAAEDSQRTNFCWENETGAWQAAPLCDECYWDQGSETEAEEDDQGDAEEEPLPIYSFCRECNNAIEQISAVDLTDEELELEMYSHICDDCNLNPNTPPITSQQNENASPSDGQESPSPSPWSQP